MLVLSLPQTRRILNGRPQKSLENAIGACNVDRTSCHESISSELSRSNRRGFGIGARLLATICVYWLALAVPRASAGLVPSDVGAGLALSAFALTEPGSGSDVAAMATTAKRVQGGFVLNGEKTYISNGGIADIYVVFARTGEAPGARGISAFLMPADVKGLEVVGRIEVIAPHPLAHLRFNNIELPEAALIGKSGDGFKVAMSVLDVFRSTVGAAALGFARCALDEALARVRTRKIAGAPLSDLQMVQGHIADMALQIDAAALLIYRAAWTKDQGAARISREAAMAKLYATEAAQRVIDMAVQLHGGDGVRAGAVVERLYREIRALRIYEGASDVQRVVIARSLMPKGAT